MISLVGLRIGYDSERRVLVGELDLGRSPSLSWSALVFGSIATAMTGSGKFIASRMIGWVSIHSVSPVFTCLRPIAAAISPANTSVPLLTLVGVHLQNAAHSLALDPFVALYT